VVNPIHLYSFEDPAFPIVYIHSSSRRPLIPATLQLQFPIVYVPPRDAVHLSLEGTAFPFVYKLVESYPATALVFYCLHSSSRRVDAVRRNLEGSVFPFVYIIPRDAFSELPTSFLLSVS
jgi:hypothetical protein